MLEANVYETPNCLSYKHQPYCITKIEGSTTKHWTMDMKNRPKKSSCDVGDNRNSILS